MKNTQQGDKGIASVIDPGINLANLTLRIGKSKCCCCCWIPEDEEEAEEEAGRSGMKKQNKKCMAISTGIYINNGRSEGRKVVRKWNSVSNFDTASFEAALSSLLLMYFPGNNLLILITNNICLLFLS